MSSKDLALKHGLPLEKIYFGIDVWAQNKTKLTQPRITYPERGGGGTNTGVAVKKLSDMEFSAGVFAPAWSFEHFPGDCTPNHGPGMDRVMWEGCDLPDSSAITCSCGDARQRHPANREHPITTAAFPFPASSDMFFYSDFSMPFAYHSDNESHKLYNGMILHSQLAAQSVLPDPPEKALEDGKRDPLNFLTHSVQIGTNRAFLRVTASPRETHNPTERAGLRIYEQFLPLFRLDMPADGTLQLSMSYSCPSHDTTTEITDIYLKFTDAIQKIRLEDCKSTERKQTMTQEINASKEYEGYVRLVELGVHVRSDTALEQPIHIVDIHEIRIVPQDYPDVSGNYTIDGIIIEKRGTDDTKHWRLRWEYSKVRHQDDGSTLTLPETLLSDPTGPFSYFVAAIEGLNLGRFYALECVLPAQLVEELVGKQVHIELTGFGFDGREIARCEDRHLAVPF